MSRIIACGDSFVAGDQDTTSTPDHSEYLKNQVSFVSLIAKKLNCDLINLSERGNSNYKSIDSLLEFMNEEGLCKGDIILFGLIDQYKQGSKFIYNTSFGQF